MTLTKSDLGCSLSLSFIVLLVGCSLTVPKITGEYPIVMDDSTPIYDGESKLLIFNATNPVMFSASGRLNVTLNGKGAAQLDIGEYTELIVPQGKYRVDLVHHDVLSFSSSHDIDINSTAPYLEVRATMVSNSARVVSELPPDFKEVYYRR